MLNNREDYWIGLKKNPGARWKWLDGLDFAYSDWDANQPSELYG
jgi:hypothetical protein